MIPSPIVAGRGGHRFFYVWLFSLIGLLTSLRLKAELEECLGKLQALSTFVEPQRALRLQLYGSLAPSR